MVLIPNFDWEEFAPDSPLEGDGFEPSVPRARNGSFWWKREDF
jgi:hypothetical protein